MNTVECYLHELAATGRSRNTIRTYKTCLTQADLTDPASYLLTINHPATRNTRRNQLRAYYSWRIRQGLDTINPIDKTRASIVPRRYPRHLSIKEVVRLVDAAGAYGRDKDNRGTIAFGHLSKEAHRARLQSMISLQVQTGLRPGELCEVRIENLNPADHRINVIGKGDKERSVVYGEFAAPYLQDWMHHWLGLQTDDLRDYPGWLYCTRSFGHVSPRAYQNELHEAARWAELRDVTPHVLRHTFATLQLEAGVPLEKLQRMMGHEDYKTTQGYLHARAEWAWEGSVLRMEGR